MRGRWLILISLIVAGCLGDFQLISFSQGPIIQKENTWRQEKKPELPRNQMETLAVKAASSQIPIREGNLTVASLFNDGKYTVVAAVEDAPADSERFAPKKVMRYRILAGAIAAVSGPFTEPFPDVEFEKAIIFAARKALGGSSVVPYTDNIHAVTLRGTSLGRCAGKVQVLDGLDSAGRTLFEKTVDFCDAE